MAIMIDKGGDFTKIEPSKVGAHHGVCCEVSDRGIMDTKFGQKRKICLVFQVAERIEGTGNPDIDGRRKEIRRYYNATTGQGSDLRRDLESWRGEPLSDADFNDNGQFDVEKVTGVQATIIVTGWTEPDEKQRQYPILGAVLPPDDFAAVKRLGHKLEGANDLEPEGYIPIDERQGNADFPPHDDAGAASAAGAATAAGKAGAKKPPF